MVRRLKALVGWTHMDTHVTDVTDIRGYGLVYEGRGSCFVSGGLRFSDSSTTLTGAPRLKRLVRQHCAEQRSRRRGADEERKDAVEDKPTPPHDTRPSGTRHVRA